MIVLVINHDVADYDRWKAVLDEFPPANGGALFHRINRSVDDANNITVVAGNSDLQEAMGRAGVQAVS